MYLSIQIPKPSFVPDGKAKEAHEADAIYGHEGLWMIATIPLAVGLVIGEGPEANKMNIACQLRLFYQSTRLTGKHATPIST